MRKGTGAEAEQAYSRALALDGESVPAYVGLAQVVAARGDVAGARRYWEEALRRELGNRVAQQELRRLPEASAGENKRDLPPR